MPLIHRENGLSLIEVVLSVFLISTVVVTLAMVFPKTSQGIVKSRQRSVAGNLATARIEAIKSQPYDLTDTTDATLGTHFSPTCDCTAMNWSALPPSSGVLISTQTQIVQTTYNVNWCVNYVSPPASAGAAWTPSCASDPAGDTGYKNVVVNVSWGNDTASQTVQESLLTRS